MNNFILIVQGTRQKRSKMSKPDNRNRAVLTEVYSVIKGLIITILGGLAVLYLAGLFLL